MYQVMKMSEQFYGVNVDSLDEEERNERIETFTYEGTPVIIVEDLSDLEDLGIDSNDINIVEI